jgi:hypothetical protein
MCLYIGGSYIGTNGTREASTLEVLRYKLTNTMCVHTYVGKACYYVFSCNRPGTCIYVTTWTEFVNIIPTYVGTCMEKYDMLDM